MFVCWQLFPHSAPEVAVELLLLKALFLNNLRINPHDAPGTVSAVHASKSLDYRCCYCLSKTVTTWITLSCFYIWHRMVAIAVYWRTLLYCFQCPYFADVVSVWCAARKDVFTKRLVPVISQQLFSKQENILKIKFLLSVLWVFEHVNKSEAY